MHEKYGVKSHLSLLPWCKIFVSVHMKHDATMKKKDKENSFSRDLMNWQQANQLNYFNVSSIVLE